MKIKEWKLAQEGKQFILINDTTAKRLKDGAEFVIGQRYIHSSSALPEFIVYFMITEFHSDQVYVTAYLDAYGTSSYYKQCQINNIVKTKNSHGEFVHINMQTTRRRRVAPKKK